MIMNYLSLVFALRSLVSIVVESNELLRDRFLLAAFVAGFCLVVVGFFASSLVVMDDYVDVVFVVVGLLFCFIGFFVVAAGCCYLLFLSFNICISSSLSEIESDVSSLIIFSTDEIVFSIFLIFC